MQTLHLTLSKAEQSIKWRHDYILAIRKNAGTDTMDTMLDRIFEETEGNVKENFKQYYVKVSEMNGSFFVLVKRRRRKIFGEKHKFFSILYKKLTEDIYLKFSNRPFFFEKNYFLYFKLVKSYGNLHFHFLVVKKDYGC